MTWQAVLVALAQPFTLGALSGIAGYGGARLGIRSMLSKTLAIATPKTFHVSLTAPAGADSQEIERLIHKAIADVLEGAA